uniref:Glutamate-rich protein 6-like n=1 Tax=Phallusia mammillata TaxID=59560 RepID=A0A6F9DC34_9ASCI|nr:glutamate-rich protein 6-like [Phallusia mammillata]
MESDSQYTDTIPTEVSEQVEADPEINSPLNPAPTTENEENENDSLSQNSETDLQVPKVHKAHVPSALTVENVRKYEEETEPVDFAELMAKAPPGSSTAESEVKNDGGKNIMGTKPLPPIAVGPHKTLNADKKYDSPATKEITKGLKFTGEEYIAISIDVQTDESWLYQYGSWQNEDDNPLKLFPSRPTIAVAASQSSSTNETPFHRKKKIHITSDISTSELLDSDGVPTDGIMVPSEATVLSRSTTPKNIGESTTSNMEDDNPVTGMLLVESGGESDAESRTTGTSTIITSVGPPRILQYKAESKSAPIDYSEIEKTLPTDRTWEDLSPEEQEHYNRLLEEMAKWRKEQEELNCAVETRIDIEPHAAYGTQQEKKIAKEQAAERLRAHEAERQKQTVTTNQTNFYAFARQLKTVNYSLSSEKCMDEGWTIRPMTPPTPPEPAKEFFVQDVGTDIVSGKRYRQTFVYKQYDNGKDFLSVFADGTGTVWYASGNVAMSILPSTKPGKLIYILHEDKDPDEIPTVQAMFQPNGNCTCYYSSGKIHLILSAFGGEYFSEYGERTKKWRWKDTETHVHAPPFQPITIGISKQAGLRVLSQENIFLTFTDGRRSVRFNVGTKLRLKQALPKLDPIDMDTVILHEKVAYIQSIIERIQYTNKFPNSPRLAKMKLPNYLSAKLEKAARLRAAYNEQQPGEKKLNKKKQKLKGNESLVNGSFIAAEKKMKHRRQLPTSKEANLNVAVNVN